MGQFVGCLQGMAEACRALDFPVVSGNVSLYNETKNEDGTTLAILPTPAIGGVWFLEKWETSATIRCKAAGEQLVLIGHSKGHVGQSLWLDVCHGRRVAPPPPVDLAAEKRAGECILGLIASGLVTAVHDCSDGGAAVAVAEMALAGNTGLRMTVVEQIPNPAAILFGEDQGRYVVTTRDPDGVRAAANAAQLFAVPIGTTGGDRITFDLLGRGGEQSVSLTDLRTAHEGFFRELMGSELAPEF
jgi:phosphoribosylformylglycinamidine (FGAM) synthase-like enzyme